MARKATRQHVEFDDPAAAAAGTSGRSSVSEYDPDQPVAPPHRTQAVGTADTLAVGDDWFAAQDELERRFNGSREGLASAQAQETGDYRTGSAALIGTGVGFRSVGGLLTPEMAVKAYVTEKVPLSALDQTLAIPSAIAGHPVDVEAVGDVVPQMYTRRYPRPVRCGVSVGHPSVTAGTIGCLVVLNNDRLCLLSNNHVIADSNAARRGNPIIQPGPMDGGGAPADRIGVLEDFVRIRFPGPNLVDAAVAWTAYRYVEPAHVTYRLNPEPTGARLGTTVMKNGRTTQATVGTVVALNVTISVGYRGGVAQFRSQLEIRGVAGDFSRGGDSGALIVTLNSRQPVALLFAGSRDNTRTFANPIDAVISELGIREFVDQS